jgi:hypothetical protein
MYARTWIVWAVVIASASIWATRSAGRQIEPWPYDKLFNKADFVVIAKVQSVEDAGKDVVDKPPFDDLIGVLTTFKVEHVVKGDLKDKKLSVFHYRHDPGWTGGNGPLLVHFHAKSFKIEYGGGVRPFLSPNTCCF